MPLSVKTANGSNLRKALPLVIGLAVVVGFVIAARHTGADLGAATSPEWLPLIGAFAISALVQPLRAIA